MSGSFTVYPAIDVRAGRVVRLAQGDYGRETRYEGDPLALALGYADQGARWLHLVDLDAARDGGYALVPLLRQLRQDGRLQVQTGGGVRSREDVSRMLDAGAARVVVGSLAVRAPDEVVSWLRDFGPDRITVALDARLDGEGVWRLPVHGWTETGSQRLDDLLQRYAAGGLRHLLSTDIDRDGMLNGISTALYGHLRRLAPGLEVQASGGVAVPADIAAARRMGCGGVVLGRALLEGRFTLADALGAAAC